MTPLAITCNDNPIGALCAVLRDRDFSGSDVLGYVVQGFLQGLFMFLVVFVAGRVLQRITLRTLTRTTTDAQLRTLIRNVFVIATLTVASLSAVTAAGLDIKVLLTFGGLASLALGLAFQDLLRNILAGIFLLVERPFRIGDLITVGDLTGSVQTIQLRTTAMRTTDGRLAIVPNVTAFNGTVVNATAYDQRQYSVSVRLAPGVELDSALGRVRAVIEANQAVAREPRPFVQPRLDADGGVTLVVRYWVQYRSNDPDALAAALVGGIYEALGPWPAVTPPPPPPGTPAQ